MPVFNKKITLFALTTFVILGFLAMPASQASAKTQSDIAANKIEILSLSSWSTKTGSSTLVNIDNSQRIEKVRLTSKSSAMKSNGLTLAVVVMGWMIITLFYVGVTYVRGMSALPRILTAGWLEYALPILCAIGLGVAGYLSYVEIYMVEAVCGPVGDCNAVQSSIYAKLFGFLPIGVLGMAGYFAILGAWLYPQIRKDRLAHYAPVANFCMATFGVIFSIYLTYLEIFVIRAVCMWCITSAILMTLLLLVSLEPALQVMDEGN
ncbi:MAG: vitamin K epoxide reductase family protein [Chloroflexi bacterium]|nr:vitamin K epoxide reductase family protein [Chloroflexota bacterium]